MRKLCGVEWVRKFGLKLSKGKFKITQLNMKLKGYKLELSEKTRQNENGFELWNKTIQKKMKKKVKLHLWSEVLLTKSGGQSLTHDQLLQKKKTANEEETKQGQEPSKQEVAFKQDTLHIKENQSDLEPLLTCKADEMKQWVERFLKTLRKKIQKYNINQPTLNEYLRILEQVTLPLSFHSSSARMTHSSSSSLSTTTTPKATPPKSATSESKWSTRTSISNSSITSTNSISPCSSSKAQSPWSRSKISCSSGKTSI